MEEHARVVSPAKLGANGEQSNWIARENVLKSTAEQANKLAYTVWHRIRLLLFCRLGPRLPIIPGLCCCRILLLK